MCAALVCILVHVLKHVRALFSSINLPHFLSLYLVSSFPISFIFP